MAAKKRRKTRRNVQMGYFDGSGFHPIRASKDYDSSRLFEDTEGSYKRKKKSKAKKGKRKNPTTSISGWVRAKAVKIVRNKAGKAVSVKIKT